MRSPVRFGLCGAGFWAGYQLAAWQEVDGAQCVAVCDPVREKAEQLAAKSGISQIYTDAAEMIDRERPDFVDIVTSVETHAPLVRLAASRKAPAICQKPLATSLAEAEEISAASRQAGVPLLVHENWRWQTPLRAAAVALREGTIGTPFRARIDMVSGFPVFVNQPGLKELEQFILADMGTHILDVARFFFGEAESLFCQTEKVHQDIRGEDVATVMMRMRSGPTVLCQMGYAENHLEHDCFPETLLFVEGHRGSLELAPDFRLRVTTEAGTFSRRVPPPRYAWANPAYDVVHASMPACQTNLLTALRGEGQAETTAEDNLKTLRLVYGAYESARTGRAVQFDLVEG